MSDRILQKYTGRNGGEEAEATIPAEVDAVDDLGSMGWLRGIRDRALMLELRKKSGNIVAVGYGWIEKVEYDPSEGITLHALGQKIRIRGRNLNREVRPTIRLFEGLCRHRIPWIQETDHAALLKAEKSATVIESIEW